MTSAQDGPLANRECVLEIDETVYERTTVLRACYWYTEQCYVFVERKTPGVLTVHLRSKAGNDVARVAGEFTNTLLDYELRRQIDLETAETRRLLVAKAVSTVEILDPPPDQVREKVTSDAV